MIQSEDDSRPRYTIAQSDRFEADLERAILSANLAGGPKYSEEWEQRLNQLLDELPGFPGPLSHARDEDASTLYRREVRRLLYHGPSRRRSKHPARVLFTLIPPAEDDPHGETVISLLRLLRGGQSLPADEAATDPTGSEPLC